MSLPSCRPTWCNIAHTASSQTQARRPEAPSDASDLNESESHSRFLFLRNSIATKPLFVHFPLN
ncbi:hypothetical protein AGR13a_Cc20201 [Agrobacterium genomosp. 13 str. CFBP 6927]|uniref:Uncharacterized protein n=1 Tax=Agrobacterium genomosp. 13 str. CFBP 6927 TaxID=1183428 RepID=A0ABM9VD15_9HYPH|nr:hypothetical protein AGR13a_Cc20201 [Agrobacterium genomosp. 13 str. CFBP 6927]